MIEFRNVTKTYNDKKAVDDISLKIDGGEFVFLIGPSGAGKSTFLNLLLKVISPDKGEIIYNDYSVNDLSSRQVPKHRRNIGIVYQDFSLLTKKTAYVNIAYAMQIIQAPKKLIRRQVPKVLALVGLSDSGGKYPSQLSQGEEQRIAIARALVNNPSVLIADEPTGNLDPETGWGIMTLLEQINNRGTTVIMVTHSKDIVDAMKKRVIAIDNGKLVNDEEDSSYHFDKLGIVPIAADDKTKEKAVPFINKKEDAKMMKAEKIERLNDILDEATASMENRSGLSLDEEIEEIKNENAMNINPTSSETEIEIEEKNITVEERISGTEIKTSKEIKKSEIKNGEIKTSDEKKQRRFIDIESLSPNNKEGFTLDDVEKDNEKGIKKGTKKRQLSEDTKSLFERFEAEDPFDIPDFLENKESND
jgi:cell division transport system ATP-binding protein